MKSKGTKPRKGKIFSCKQCGKEFYLSNYQAERKQATGNKYCSRKCFSESLKTNGLLICVECGKEFYVSKSQQRDRNRKTCSINCKNEYMSKLKSGENCLFWKGGISSENRLLRYSREMNKWRKAVFERDNYTCQSCGIRGTYLQAHHIKPFCDYPELRFDINNGQTLCLDCHEMTKNGSRKLTKDQIVSIQKDNRGCMEIANNYGVSKSLIWNVKNDDRYKLTEAGIDCPSRPVNMTIE